MTWRPKFESRVVAASILLGHDPGPLAHTAEGYASAECARPGCNMGFTVEPERAHGAAVTYVCPAFDAVAESGRT